MKDMELWVVVSLLDQSVYRRATIFFFSRDDIMMDSFQCILIFSGLGK